MTELEIRTHIAAASMQAWLDFELARGRPRQSSLRAALTIQQLLRAGRFDISIEIVAPAGGGGTGRK